jgi:hypothetical protein
MGAFSTYTSLATLMPGTTFDTQTNNLASKCIDQAESYIKARLSRRYDVSALPFTVATTTSMATNFSETYAMGLVFKYQSRGAKESIARGDALIKDVVSAIDKIVEMKSDLLDATTGGSPISERTNLREVLCNTSNYHATFDEDDPLDWTEDEDKLTDIENGRL